MIQEIGLSEGSIAELRIQDHSLVLNKVNTQNEELQHLLSQITPDNLHGEMDSGYAVGNEGIE